MDAVQTLNDFIAGEFEYPLPTPETEFHYIYPPRDNSVGCTVVGHGDGVATFTIAVAPQDMDEARDAAALAIARNMGLDPDKTDAVAQARLRMGADFEQRLGNMVRLNFFSVAIMRTGILPFMAPQFLASPLYEAGQVYSYQVRTRVRPVGELASYDPVQAELPVKPQVSDKEIDDRLNQLVGGDIPWDQADGSEGTGVASMRARVREQLEKESQGQWADAAMGICASELARRLTVEPPAEYVALLRNEMGNAYAANLVSSGVDWDAHVSQPDFDMEGFKAAMENQAAESLRRGMALDAYAQHEGVRLTEEDVLDAAGLMVTPGHEREALAGMLQTGQLAQLCEATLRIKANNRLLEASLA